MLLDSRLKSTWKIDSLLGLLSSIMFNFVMLSMNFEFLNMYPNGVKR